MFKEENYLGKNELFKLQEDAPRAEKTADYILTALSSASAIYTILYYSILLDIPAPNCYMYRFGIVFVNLCIAIISSFIFYFITVKLPQYIKLKSLIPLFISNINSISSSLNEITRILTGQENWVKLDNSELKVSTIKFNENRFIWSEIDNNVYKEENMTHLVEKTVFRLEYELNKMDTCLNKLYFFNIPKYAGITQIITNYCNSYFHSQLKLAISMAEKMRKKDFVLSNVNTNENYCTMVFREELPLRLFHTAKGLEKPNINLIREIISETALLNQFLKYDKK